MIESCVGIPAYLKNDDFAGLNFGPKVIECALLGIPKRPKYPDTRKRERWNKENGSQESLHYRSIESHVKKIFAHRALEQEFLEEGRKPMKSN